MTATTELPRPAVELPRQVPLPTPAAMQLPAALGAADVAGVAETDANEANVATERILSLASNDAEADAAGVAAEPDADGAAKADADDADADGAAEADADDASDSDNDDADRLLPNQELLYAVITALLSFTNLKSDAVAHLVADTIRDADDWHDEVVQNLETICYPLFFTQHSFSNYEPQDTNQILSNWKWYAWFRNYVLQMHDDIDTNGDPIRFYGGTSCCMLQSVPRLVREVGSQTQSTQHADEQTSQRCTSEDENGMRKSVCTSWNLGTWDTSYGRRPPGRTPWT